MPPSCSSVHPRGKSSMEAIRRRQLPGRGRWADNTVAALPERIEQDLEPIDSQDSLLRGIHEASSDELYSTLSIIAHLPSALRRRWSNSRLKRRPLKQELLDFLHQLCRAVNV